MRKKRSSSKPTTPISLIRGAIGAKNSKPLAIALEEFKSKGQIEKFPSVYALALHNKSSQNILPAGRKVKEIRRLGFDRPLKSASLSRELQWASVICYFSESSINKFVPLREEFYSMFASSNFVRANQILDDIDRECGKSLWVIENKVCLLSAAEGFEYQKKYVANITKQHPRTNVAFMAANISERNEQRVTAKAFEQRLRHRATSWDISYDQISHIFYRLCNTIDSTEQAYSAVLANEASYSCIDLYETLLSVIRRSKKMPFYDSASAEASLYYLDNINDSRKNSLINYIKGENIKTRERRFPEYHEFFQQGRYEDVIRNASEFLENDPWDIDAIVACAKASCACKQPLPTMGWFGNLIAPNLCSFFSASYNAEDAVDALIKLANNFRHADFSVPLIMLMKSRTHRWFHRVDEQYALIKIFIPDGVSFVEIFESQAIQNNELATDDFKRSSALFSAIINDQIDQALGFAKDLSSSDNLYYRMLGKSFHVHLLAKCELTTQAIEESVEALIDHPGLVEFTPLIDILRPRGFRHLKDLADSATLSCAFHIYIDHMETTDKDVSLKVSWKNFLSANRISKPSEFKTNTGYSKIEAFFLSNVCTQETMELGGAFSSQLDLDRERMAICANLSAAIPKDSDIFNQEIVDLTRRINIEDGVELLESSRIFVDQIGIQKWAKKNLNSQFLRYKDHLGIGLEESVDKMSVDVVKILESSEGYMSALTDYLENYDITADALLEDVTRELSQAFLQLPRYGLDSFLSSRVRHGSFVGYIRGPLESHRLLTKKKTDSPKYHDNDYILNKWGINGVRERRLINARLATLSESVDSVLDEVVEKHLHVKSKTHPDGMVVFSSENRSVTKLLKSWVVAIKANLNENTELEPLITFIFENFLWPCVRPSLDQIKAYVQADLGDCLSGLLESFVAYVGGIVSKDIRDVVAADVSLVIPEFRDALRRVSLWFDLPQVNSQMLIMPLQRALEIGLVSARNARFGFNPNVEWNVQPDANIHLKGQSISIFNDLTFLIFMNIAKHSGFEDDFERDEQADICINVTTSEGYIRVRVSNNISKNKSLEIVRSRLKVADERIKRRDFDALDKQKDGTGLARLALYFDGDDQAQKNFLYWISDEERKFYVQMQLPPTMVRAIGAGNE